MQYVSSPHTKDFPAAEFVEKALATDFLIIVSLDEPVCQAYIVNRLIILIGCDALA
jgi:hypothetical protein